MSFYTDALATVADSLREFGADATLTRVTPGEYDPATSAVGAGTTATATVRALESASERSYLDGSLIEAGRMAYLIDPTGLSITPMAGDTFEWGGVVRTVAKSMPLAPAGIAVMVEVQVTL